jgi:hypothetical protein
MQVYPAASNNLVTLLKWAGTCFHAVSEQLDRIHGSLNYIRTHAPGTMTMVGLYITSEKKYPQQRDVYKKDCIRRLREFTFPDAVLMLAFPVPAGCS